MNSTIHGAHTQSGLFFKSICMVTIANYFEFKKRWWYATNNDDQNDTLLLAVCDEHNGLPV